MVMLSTSFRYIQDKDGYYHEIGLNGNPKKRKFKKLDSLASWVGIKFKLLTCGVIVIFALLFGLISLLFS